MMMRTCGPVAITVIWALSLLLLLHCSATPREGLAFIGVENITAGLRVTTAISNSDAQYRESVNGQYVSPLCSASSSCRSKLLMLNQSMLLVIPVQGGLVLLNMAVEHDGVQYSATHFLPIRGSTCDPLFLSPFTQDHVTSVVCWSDNAVRLFNVQINMTAISQSTVSPQVDYTSPAPPSCLTNIVHYRSAQEDMLISLLCGTLYIVDLKSEDILRREDEIVCSGVDRIALSAAEDKELLVYCNGSTIFYSIDDYASIIQNNGVPVICSNVTFSPVNVFPGHVRYGTGPTDSRCSLQFQLNSLHPSSWKCLSNGANTFLVYSNTNGVYSVKLSDNCGGNPGNPSILSGAGQCNDCRPLETINGKYLISQRSETGFGYSVSVYDVGTTITELLALQNVDFLFFNLLTVILPEATPTLTPSTSSTPSSPTVPPTLSPGAIVGIVIGLVILVIIMTVVAVVVVAVAVICYRKNSCRHSSPTQSLDSGTMECISTTPVQYTTPIQATPDEDPTEIQTPGQPTQETSPPLP